MLYSIRYCSTILLVSLLFMTCMELSAHAIMDASFELDPQALGVSAASKKQVRTDSRQNGRNKGRVSGEGTGEGFIHTIKPGDNLLKILISDYGLSYGEAESLIGIISRENNITDLKNLKIGQKITIPPLPRRSGRKAKQTNETLPVVSSGQAFRLESPEAALSEAQINNQVQQTWEKLVPAPSGGQKPIVLESSTFSLTLDPQRYPVYATMDNSSILVDTNNSIPPLVKALIMEKDPSVRIVSESPRNGKRFLSAMLESAGFYSVEEDFSMDFGTDPTLTINSDFRVEKTSDSLINQDLVLMNAAQNPLPAVISTFLKNEGFAVYEPFVVSRPFAVPNKGRLRQVTSGKQSDIVDALLLAISVEADKDRRLDVFAAKNNGVYLSVKADRYFERAGQRYVVTSFDGDPVVYTLYRILENNGYNVTILESKDDFRKVSEKILNRLRIPAVYAKHKLSPDTEGSYALNMSGFKLENTGDSSAGVFLTNLELDLVIRDLLAAEGYNIITK